MSVFTNVVAFSQIRQSADQILQFIKDISRFILNLSMYFNGTSVSTFTVPALPVLFVNYDLNLNGSEFNILSSGSCLQ